MRSGTVLLRSVCSRHLCVGDFLSSRKVGLFFIPARRLFVIQLLYFQLFSSHQAMAGAGDSPKKESRKNKVNIKNKVSVYELLESIGSSAGSKTSVRRTLEC